MDVAGAMDCSYSGGNFSCTFMHVSALIVDSSEMTCSNHLHTLPIRLLPRRHAAPNLTVSRPESADMAYMRPGQGLRGFYETTGSLAFQDMSASLHEGFRGHNSVCADLGPHLIQ